MRREKKERNEQIIKRIKRGDYQIDIARDFNISEARVSMIKRYYFNREKRPVDNSAIDKG